MSNRNPNQGNPIYGGNNLNQQDNSNIMCYNCKQMGHYARNCPNARASVPYVPLCGNCGQVGHTSDQCNGPKRENPRNNDGLVRNSDISAKLVLLPDDYKPNDNERAVHQISINKEEGKIDYAKPVTHVGIDSSEQIQNAQLVTTRARAAKQIPIGSQPIVSEDKVPSSSFDDGKPIGKHAQSGAAPLIQSGPTVVPIGNNGSRGIKDVPIGTTPLQKPQLESPMVVPIEPNRKYLNPVINGEFNDYQPAPNIQNHPLINSREINKEQLNREIPIGEDLELLPEHPNWRKHTVPIVDQPVLVKPNRFGKIKKI
ncbi:MAG TPA: hypothetical protein VEQ18_05910 [Candidatus Nitrosocosmicus sp.]|nr:hypothetical protein [Candidatus Nitrosocosmicus sp.]